MSDVIGYIADSLHVECKLRCDNEFEVSLCDVDIVSTIKFLYNNEHFKFNTLIDIFAVDYPEIEDRFELIYILLDINNNLRIICKVALKEGKQIESITSIFNAANWFEREVFDMYGIVFSHHPDLRRILTDYGFQGHPMLKDFPLSGYNQVRYDLISKKVIYEPLDLNQEFRNFDFLSPWQGINISEK